MGNEEKDDRMTIEIKITIPRMYKGVGDAFDHLLKATEEVVKAGKSVVQRPEIKSKVKKIEVK